MQLNNNGTDQGIGTILKLCILSRYILAKSVAMAPLLSFSDSNSSFKDFSSPFLKIANNREREKCK